MCPVNNPRSASGQADFSVQPHVFKRPIGNSRQVGTGGRTSIHITIKSLLTPITKISNQHEADAFIFENPRNGNGIKDSGHFETLDFEL